LKNAEMQTQNQISSYDEKIAANQKVISRLNSQLRKVQHEMADTESMLEESHNRLERAKRKYLGDIRQFYMKAARRTTNPLWESPRASMQSNRQLVYLAALAEFESGNVSEAGQFLEETLDRMDELTGTRQKVASLKKDKETATALDVSQKERNEKALEKLRRKKLAEGDRVLTLKQAAEEMERVIARLEEERRQQPDTRPRGPSVFATLKGSLRPPVKGKIVVPFGPATDPITRLKSFSPGITIEARPGAPVVAVAAGEVAYVGNLRGYGRFVIINHDDEYYTTYAGLGEPSVTTGEFVTGSTALAPVGEDGQLKFELRKGREPLDPVTWIRIDSY
jgi:septal ring factor EnvC (AmiA/AmiB activator)